jgi:hypothetical protein
VGVTVHWSGLDLWNIGLDWTTGLNFVVTQSTGAEGVICIGNYTGVTTKHCMGQKVCMP